MFVLYKATGRVCMMQLQWSYVRVGEGSSKSHVTPEWDLPVCRFKYEENEAVVAWSRRKVCFRMDKQHTEIIG